MNKLSYQKVLEENHTQDPSSITSLQLNHKALSDVSCLSEFKNLERLDLSFNNLSSLQGLSQCVNLKWLSVSQNKLQNLQGIENLTKLTVLNASRNKLKTMDEVKSLSSLGALILNDNQISSICRFDELKDLNTIVLSRNPIHDIGESLVKLKSITKLSLSNCQLETIGSSLSSLLYLKELRLAHNEITTLPVELAHNIRLQNLDLGNNSITRFSNLKVLSSLHHLKSLNLHGNPVAEKEDTAKKVKKLVPNLQIFNSRPIERSKKNEGSGKACEDDTIGEAADLKVKEVKVKKTINNESVSKKGLSQREDNSFDKAEIHVEREGEHKMQTMDVNSRDVSLNGSTDAEVGKNTKRQKKLELKKDMKSISKKTADEHKLYPAEDRETTFTESTSEAAREHIEGYTKKVNGGIIHEIKSHGVEVVGFPAKRKKGSKNGGSGQSTFQFVSSEVEVGMGGPSAWDE